MTHTLEAVAWTLIHACWQAAVIALIYRAAVQALARCSSNARYAAALAAMLAMPVAAGVTFAVEIQKDAPAIALPASAAFAVPNFEGMRSIEQGTGSDSAARQAVNAQASARDLLPWIDGLWILGVMGLSLRSLGGWWLIQRLRRTASVDAPEAVRAAFSRISKALELNGAASLRVSSAIAGPVTVGALRAVVLLPLSAITSLGPEELEVVLAHELAHVRRADFAWNLVQTAIETLFFFHPAVWWIGGQLRHERELCCDDLALTVCPNPMVYASALVRLEEQRARQMRLAMALDGHQPGKTLRLRIARILGEPTARIAGKPLQPFSLTASAVALITVLILAPQVLASLHPAQTKAAVAAIVARTEHAVKPPASHLMAPEGAQGTAPSALQLAESATRADEAEMQTSAPSRPDESASASEAQAAPAGQSSGKGDYIDQMKSAGYGDDLDKLIALKIQGITPEYARAMSEVGLGKLTADELIAMKIQNVTAEYIRGMQQAGFGKLTANDLVACKIQGVTPEYLSELKNEGFAIENVQQAISFRIFKVTPEFLTGMKAAGFDHLSSEQVIALRVQGVTPEFAKQLTQDFSGITVDNLVQAKIFRINGDFVAQAKQHGFTNLTFEKLVKLRISGLMDDESNEK
jgi:beta-lactamase regulating signal transducer with metallopeptidase domain